MPYFGDCNKVKLTWQQHDEIRDRAAKEGLTYKQAAREYGISESHAGNIINGNVDHWGVRNPNPYHDQMYHGAVSDEQLPDGGE